MFEVLNNNNYQNLNSNQINYSNLLEQTPAWIATGAATLGVALLLYIGIEGAALSEKYFEDLKTAPHIPIMKKSPKERHLHLHLDLPLSSSEEEKNSESESEKEAEKRKEEAAQRIGLAKEIVSVNAGSFLLSAHTIEFFYLLSRIGRDIIPGFPGRKTGRPLPLIFQNRIKGELSKLGANKLG